MIVGYNCPAAIPHQIRETTTIWQFHSKAVCTVSRYRVCVYPGTEGTNQTNGEVNISHENTSMVSYLYAYI